MSDQYSVTLDAHAFAAVWKMVTPRSYHPPVSHLVAVEQVKEGATIAYSQGVFVAVRHDPTAMFQDCAQMCLYKHGRGTIYSDNKTPPDASHLRRALGIKTSYQPHLTIGSTGTITRYKRDKTFLDHISGDFVVDAARYPKWRKLFPNLRPITVSNAPHQGAVFFSPDAIKGFQKFLGDDYTIGLLQAQGTSFPYYLLAVAQDGHAAMVYCPLITPTLGCVSLASPTLAGRPSAAPDCLLRFGFGC